MGIRGQRIARKTESPRSAVQGGQDEGKALAVEPAATEWLLEPETETVKSNPVPCRGTEAALARVEVVTVRLPACEPAEVGTNAAAAVQLAPGARVVAQLLLVSWVSLDRSASRALAVSASSVATAKPIHSTRSRQPRRAESHRLVRSRSTESLPGKTGKEEAFPKTRIAAHVRVSGTGFPSLTLQGGLVRTHHLRHAKHAVVGFGMVERIVVRNRRRAM